MQGQPLTRLCSPAPKRLAALSASTSEGQPPSCETQTKCTYRERLQGGVERRGPLGAARLAFRELWQWWVRDRGRWGEREACRLGPHAGQPQASSWRFSAIASIAGWHPVGPGPERGAAGGLRHAPHFPVWAPTRARPLACCQCHSGEWTAVGL